MAQYRSLICDDEERRALLRAHPNLHGIDYVEVVTAPPADNQLVLDVFFIAKTTALGQASLAALLAALDGATGRVSIAGGVRVQEIKVTSVALVGDHLRVRVSQPGDFSTYTLRIADASLDPAYSAVDFSFKAGCPSRFDCQPRAECPPEPRVEPLIDYMAKDYASFRQMLIDLIPTLAPGWIERNPSDLGIALVELLAYAGDQLSYYQDAVANEAYLETARQRVSIRRHARLIDYQMHDGASARTFVHIAPADGGGGTLPAGTQILSRIDVPVGPNLPPHGPVFPPAQAERALDAALTVFETLGAATLHARLNRIAIHPWGNRQCCLPRRVTTVDLVGDLAFDPALDGPGGLRGESWRLKPGDFMLFEEVLGPQSGLPADADLSHRQVVRLTAVETARDPLLALDLTRVAWDRADGLRFPLCLSARRADGTPIDDVSVARGNLALADHGRTLPAEWHPGDPVDPRIPGIAVGRRAYRFRLREGPLSFRVPLPASPAPAMMLLQDDPRNAVAQVSLDVFTGPVAQPGWTPAPTLLDSDPLARNFAVETENDGRALIRFGDDEYGQAPPDQSHIRAVYRVGLGTSGNVGAEALAHVVNPGGVAGWPAIVRVRNPLPAWGGVDPEPIEQVRRHAPAAFRAVQFRAVTEDDYARVAERHPEVARAVATFRWTGSWHTVFLTIDPVGRTDLPPELQRRVRDWVARFTQAGYDLEIDPPQFVSLEIMLDICVAPNHFRADVEQALLRALSNQTLPDGSRGFFHPDNFTFGQSVYLSRLYAAVEAVAGVDSAVARVFKRFGKPPAGETDAGFIPMGRLEVARLDNDPNFQENGVLRLRMRGGK